MKLKTVLKATSEVRMDIIDKDNRFFTYHIDYLREEETPTVYDTHGYYSTINGIPASVKNKEVMHISVNHATGIIEFTV